MTETRQTVKQANTHRQTDRKTSININLGN